jgi:Rps23 Pro-64 3,4-dihydroxylase Tpa1-like proline 4-hydroxylase
LARRCIIGDIMKLEQVVAQRQIAPRFEGVELNKDLKINPDAIIQLDPNVTVHAAVFDNVASPEVINKLRAELEQNIAMAHDEGDSDEHGWIRKRQKLFDPPLGLHVANLIATNPDIMEEVKHIQDYSFRSFYTGFCQEFEAAEIRYAPGSKYRWHTDHELLPGITRVLNYTLYLNDDCGGDLDISTTPPTMEMVEAGFPDLKVHAKVKTKTGRLLLVASHLLHQVTEVTSTREILLGHICLSSNRE